VEITAKILMLAPQKGNLLLKYEHLKYEMNIHQRSRKKSRPSEQA